MYSSTQGARQRHIPLVTHTTYLGRRASYLSLSHAFHKANTPTGKDCIPLHNGKIAIFASPTQKRPPCLQEQPEGAGAPPSPSSSQRPPTVGLLLATSSHILLREVEVRLRCEDHPAVSLAELVVGSRSLATLKTDLDLNSLCPKSCKTPGRLCMLKSARSLLLRSCGAGWASTAWKRRC